MSSSGSAISVRQGQLEVFFAKHGNLIWKLFVGFFVLYILMPPLLLVAVSFEPSGIVRVNTGFSLSLLLTEFLGLQRSLWTELVGHVLWALPFAFLVILTSMSVVKRETVLAAMDLGANEWRAFRDIEYPIIKPGITSAAIFSFVLSFNEFSRTYYLQGIGQTIPTYVWNKITVAITPEIFALSSLTVILSLTLIAIATIYLTTVGRVAKARKEKAIPRPAVRSRHKAPAPAATAAAEKA